MSIKGPIHLFYLDTTKLYRIWFSDDPSNFLNEENKLRFIRMRQQNPHAELFFVYSANCLSEKSKEHLQVFCNKLSIIPVDFDSDIPRKLLHAKDKAIYELARQEIAHTLNGSGGNLASASDCVRTLLPVIQQCGIYSDFDVEVNFSSVPPVVKIKSPVILDAFFKPNIYAGAGGPVYINDFFGLAYDSPDLKQLASQAIIDLRKLQTRILDNYANISIQTLYDYKPRFRKSSHLESFDVYVGKVLIKKYLAQKPCCSIFDIRNFIQSLSLEYVLASCENMPSSFDETMLKNLKWALYFNTVVMMAGPGAYSVLFDEFLAQDFSITTLEISRTLPSWDIRQRGFWGFYLSPLTYDHREEITVFPQGQWIGYKSRCQEYGLVGNGLGKYVYCKQSDRKFDEILDGRNPLEKDIGLVCDMSWTSIGAANQKERSAKIQNAVKTLQHAFRLWIENEKTKTDGGIADLTENVQKLGISHAGL